MKRFLSLVVIALSFVLLYEKACFAEENVKTVPVSSTEEELNDAQLFEKKMLDNKKVKKTKKVKSTVRRQPGAKTENNAGNSVKSSSKAMPHSNGLPSLSGGMFVK